MILHRWTGYIVVIISVSSAPIPSKSQNNDRLSTEHAITKRLSAGEIHRYELVLAPHQSLRIAVEEKSVDVRLILLGPDGKAIDETNTPNNSLDPERMVLITPASGTYRLEIRPAIPDSRPGSYVARIEELRPATETDRRRPTAARFLREGDMLRAEGSAQSLRSGLAKYEEALAVFRSLGDRRSEASSLFGVGKCRDALGEKRQALDAFNQAHRILRDENDRRGEGVVLNEIGFIHYSLGERQKALDLYDLALPFHRAADNPRGEAIALNNIGLSHLSSGDYEKALEFNMQALSRNRESNFRRGEAVNLINLGSIHDALGEKQQAISSFEQSLPISRSLGDRTREANTLNNIGAVYFSLGESQKALDHYRRAVPLWQTAGERAGEAATLHNIAHIFSVMGDTDKAIDHYQRAIELQRAVGNKAGEATTLNNIARVYSSTDEKQKALEFYDRALAILRAVNNRPVEAQTLTNIGSAHVSLGDTGKGLDFYNQALPIHRSVRNRSGEAQTLSHMGVAHLLLRDPAQAAALEAQALALFESVGDRRGEALAQYHLARAEQARRNLDEARSRIQAAVRIVESLRSNVASQQLRASYLATVQNYYESYISILMDLERERPSSGFATAALEVSERARARSLLETLVEGRVDIRSGVDPAFLERERSLELRLNARAQRKMQILTRAHTEDQVRAADREIARITAEYEEVREQIRSRSPRYAALTQPVPLDAGQIQSQVLDVETTLLEYALGEARSFVWVVSSGSVECFELPAREKIESEARRFYESVRDDRESSKEKSRELSRLLLAPIARRSLRKRLAIVAGGALQYVPFAALHDPNSHEYRPLILDYEIVHLPSASILAVMRSETAGRPLAPKTVAVIADPVFQSDDSRVQRSASQGSLHRSSAAAAKSERSVRRSGEPETSFGRLLGTRREAEAILAVAPADSRKRALDFEASHALVTGGELGQYRLVHFATHGIIDSDHPELSGVVLSLVDEKGEPRDGILRLHEIFNLKLPVELVVLSACRTALGKEIKGEGLVGLTRGFMYAGAPRILASLWKVDDRATSVLMKHFYRAMLGPERLRPAAALRSAQVAVMKEKRWQSPYYWSAFVLQGEWR